MKNHLLRPLWLAAGIVFLLLLVRHVMTPADFGVHGETFTYNFYRLGNVDEWKNFPAKYSGNDSCAECHPENAAKNQSASHRAIECENCHGPALKHPEDPEMLVIDRRRELCLRCHLSLPYKGSGRAEIKGVDPGEHNPGFFCVDCHDPHKPSLEDME
jgi:predicted CXXCH cytochrome family protein